MKLKKKYIINILLTLFFLIFPVWIVFQELFYKLGIDSKNIKVVFLLIFLFFIFLLILNNNFKIHKVFFINFILFLLLVFSVFVNINSGVFHLSYIIFGFYDIFFIYFMAILIGFLSHKKLNENSLNYYFKLLFFLGIISILFASIQKVYNSQVFYQFQNWMYLTKSRDIFRLNGIFLSHAWFASFLFFILSWSFYIWKKTYKFKFFLIFLICSIFLYWTYSKTFLMMAFAFVFLVLFFDRIITLKLRFISKGYFVLFVLFCILLSCFLMIFVQDLEYTNKGFLYTASTKVRVYYWSIIINDYFLDADLHNVIFGHTITQSGENDFLIKSTGKVIQTENLFFTIYLWGGILALLVFVSAQYILWKELFKRSNLFSKYLIIVLPIWFLGGIFGRTIGYYSFFCMMPALLSINNQVVVCRKKES
ncbi:hypothetical protein M3I01_001585 [Marinomonas sp. RSW2]|uniref:O-Antigen ligase n=1 Tax=Marinomonas maritima TaxID=2940935 RepID=A0ABT5WC37_9GAMM|nr:hypothetical protein [Marinomonas maritima]MDE8601620.1 hypothetical protein [Marinomonas maritima]